MSRETDAIRATRQTARGIIHISGVRPVTATQVRNDAATDTMAAATPAVVNVSNAFIVGLSTVGGTDTIG